MEEVEHPYSARAAAALSRETSAGVATVSQVCSLFGLSRQAYYKALKPRAPAKTRASRRQDARSFTSAEDAKAAIEAIVKAKPAWGVRKVWATMRRAPYGLRVGYRRVWALMKSMGLCLSPARPGREPARRGRVAVEEPNRRWATDLTTVWTEEDGLVAVVPVIDCGCRSMLAVGVTTSQGSLAVLAPLEEALVQAFRRVEGVPDGLELRTDHGPQFTGGDCAALVSQWGLEHTLAPIGRPTGNAVCERVIRTMKEECIWLRDWRTADELGEHLEQWMREYNEERPHMSLAYATPAERREERLRRPPLRLAA